MTYRGVSPARRAFDTAFARAGRVVRTRLALGRVATGASVGACVAAAVAFALFAAGRASFRPYAAGAVGLGLGAGLVVAQKRRLDDEEIALVLDARLASHEVIATARGVAGSTPEESPSPTNALVLARATDALGNAPPRALSVPILRRVHAAFPFGAALFVVITRLPVPVPPEVAAPPGSEMVRVADVKGLEKVIALSSLDARDDAQRERLQKLAAEAEKLRKKLEDGATKREVEADLAKLMDDLAAERMSLGDGDERKGLEAAVAELGKNADLAKAQKALGDHDLTAFDAEMQRLANLAEKSSRERAREALLEAEEAAKKQGAKGVAKALADQRKLMEQREKEGAKLRELADALGGSLGKEGLEALGDLDRSGNPAAAKKLARALEKALEGLSAEERKRLADRMKSLAKEHPEKAELGELGAELGSDPDAEKLEQELRDLANQEPESDESRRQRALDEAQRGLGQGQGQGQGKGAIPMPGPGRGSPGNQAGAGTGNGGPNGGNGVGGPGGDSARGPSNKGPSSPTNKVDAADLRAHASTELGGGTPMPGTMIGRGAARAGETANVRGTGALGTVGPDEVGGVSRSDVPEEYREQVGRYFQP